jgi:hypothetical protein
MFQSSHNEFISMDATFGTNDMKYNGLTLMAFDFHHTWAPVVWVITRFDLGWGEGEGSMYLG